MSGRGAPILLTDACPRLLAVGADAAAAAAARCSQNGYLSSRGGCPSRWHSLVNGDHGDSTTSRFDSPASWASASSSSSGG
jgi:hypothetical protein